MTKEDIYIRAIDNTKLTQCSDCVHPQSVGYCEQCCPFGVVIEALEKQIPKKPEADHHCPVCGWGLPVPYITDEYCRDCFYPNFCSDCGQAIDWSEEE